MDKEDVNVLPRTGSRPMDERCLPLDFGMNNDQSGSQPLKPEDLEKALYNSPHHSLVTDNTTLCSKKKAPLPPESSQDSAHHQ